MEFIDFRHSVQSKFFILVSLLLAALISGCSSNPVDCHSPYQLSWSNQRQLAKDIKTLSSAQFQGRKTNTQGAALAREYLMVRMLQTGMEPWKNGFEQEFEYDYQFGKRRGINLVGMQMADTPTNKWRIVIAHYDHLGQKGSKLYPGADDNASGIAAMLALSTQASTQVMPTNLLFIATDAEEPGLFGSSAFIEQLTQFDSVPRQSQIELVVNLDMVGRPGRNQKIYLEGRRNFSQFEQLKSLLQNKVGLCIQANQPPEAGKSIQRVDWLRASDHYPFHKAGVPWLYFGVPPHEDYHQSTDVVSKIDMNFLAAVTETAYQLLVIDSYLLKK
ncbi:M28 family peptidase [Shewanella sp. Isolate11]|uniref:M28 family peptidase n=1 Tax=Shewanella sp. Isolate11 TaxID=2908530 RepID=UPI001EFE65FC|nr:M28 family peptidase [Shewanella sp. Isolate11]MCG9695591.1 M28 family peptidase [Shewanella sp. Isolate11]